MDQLSFSAGTLAQAGNEDFITDFLHTFYSPHIAMLLCRTLLFSTISDGPTDGRSTQGLIEIYGSMVIFDENEVVSDLINTSSFTQYMSKKFVVI